MIKQLTSLNSLNKYNQLGGANIMKKTLISSILLSTLVLGGAQAFAADTDTATNLTTEGSIQFEAGGTTDPENPGEEPKEPEITDPNKPNPDPDPEEKPEKPGDKPGGTINPNQGELKLEFAPNFQFDKQKVSNETVTYSAVPTTYGEEGQETYKPLFAQVSDLRIPSLDEMTLSKWSLTLSATAFKGYDGEGKEVADLAAGSKIQLNDIMLVNSKNTETTDKESKTLELTGADAAQTIAKDGKQGLSVIRFGESQEMTDKAEYKGVQLVVPGKVSQSSIQGVTYKTALTWNLNAGDVSTEEVGTPSV